MHVDPQTGINPQPSKYKNTTSANSSHPFVLLHDSAPTPMQCTRRYPHSLSIPRASETQPSPLISQFLLKAFTQVFGYNILLISLCRSQHILYRDCSYKQHGLMKEEWFSPSDWPITDLVFFLSDFFSGGENICYQWIDLQYQCATWTLTYSDKIKLRRSHINVTLIVLHLVVCLGIALFYQQN